MVHVSPGAARADGKDEIWAALATAGPRRAFRRPGGLAPACSDRARHAAISARIHPRGGFGGRITADGVNRAVQAAVRRFHLTRPNGWRARFSGHSGRVGLIVASKEVGAADSDIAATTRHKSLQMIKRYGEAAEQRLRAAA